MRTSRSTGTILILASFLTALLICLSPATGAFAERTGSRNMLIRVALEYRWQQDALIRGGYDIALLRPGKFADLVVSKAELESISSLGLAYEVRKPDLNAALQPMLQQAEFGAYHSYNEVVAELDSLATAYPSLLRVYDIGDSWEKTQAIADRDIWAAKLTDNPDIEEGEPAVLIMGNHHAREIITPEIPLHILRYLLENYGTDPEVTDTVNEREIWFVPMVNPDGHVYVEQGNSMWRKNRRDNGDGSYGVDLNRNYGHEWGHDNIGSSPTPASDVYRGQLAFSEPEAAAIRDLAASEDFVFALSYHSYGNMFLYPWGYCPGFTHDQDLFHVAAESLASYNGYDIGNAASGLIYITNGDSDDWFYGDTSTKPRGFCITPEVGTEFAPPESLIEPLCQENLGPALFLIENAGYPYRLVPPGSVRIDSLGTVPQNFTLTWHISGADTNAALYELVEKRGASVFADDAESTYVPWSMAGGFVRTGATYHSPANSYFSGSSNRMNSTLTTAEGINVGAGDTLKFWCSYDIEADYDYAYVEVSTDGGRSFTSIPGNLTTNNDPHGNNAGNGITGSSGGWVEGSFPLDEYAGQTIWVRYRYWTDSYVIGSGFYVDDIFPLLRFAAMDTIASDLTQASYAFSGKDAGTYYYQVRAMDQEGLWGYAGENEAVVVQPVTSVPGGAVAETSALSIVSYPNPFNPTTVLKYTLPGKPDGASWNVRVMVFDAGGALVKKLQDSPASAGPHILTWDGTDRSGHRVRSGVYFYCLEADGRKVMGKLVLLK